MANNNEVTVEDMYDSVVDGIAQFTGIMVGVVTRYATSAVVVPENDTLMKRILRDTGSLALSTVAITVTTSGVKMIGAYLKPYIVRK